MAENEIKLSDSRHYRTNPDFILRKISGEAVLVPPGDTGFGNSMISVNETFTYLWELFSEPMTIPEALQRRRKITKTHPVRWKPRFYSLSPRVFSTA